jgi:hypothetical protein
VFWKWYLLSDAETEQTIKKILHIEEPEVKAPEQIKKDIPEPIKKMPEEKLPEPETKTDEERPRIIPMREHYIRPSSQEAARPVPIKLPEKIITEPEVKAEEHFKAPERKVERPKTDEKLDFTSDEDRTLAKGMFVDSTIKDKFLDQVKEYFSKAKVEIIDYSITKKGAEIDFVITVPSVIGGLTYYCKAKNKKKSTDTDLAFVMVQAQQRKLPAIYLHRGELTKKANEMLVREFKGMTVKRF